MRRCSSRLCPCIKTCKYCSGPCCTGNSWVNLHCKGKYRCAYFKFFFFFFFRPRLKPMDMWWLCLSRRSRRPSQIPPKPASKHPHQRPAATRQSLLPSQMWRRTRTRWENEFAAIVYILAILVSQFCGFFVNHLQRQTWCEEGQGERMSLLPQFTHQQF